MASADAWRAIRELAHAWREHSVVVDAFARELPPNALSSSAGLPAFLQEINAMGLHLNARPLRSATLVQMTQGNASIPFLKPPPDSLATDAWLENARRVQFAHQSTVGWLRSRMPGYPNFLVPQMVRGTPLTTDEFSWRLPWPRAELSRGLAMLPAPPDLARALKLQPSAARAVDAASRAVASALAHSAEFGRLADLRAEMGPKSTEALSACNARLRQALSPDAVDAFEPSLAERRSRYREQQVKDAIAGLRGAEQEYVVAFSRAEEMVELVADGVFGQLVAFGAIPARGVRGDIDFTSNEAGQRSVDFVGDSAEWWEVGSVVWISDPLVADAVLVDRVSVSFTADEGEVFNIGAEILEHTAEAWVQG